MSQDPRARTFSIEEVGEIVRQASEGDRSATADHEGVTYEELEAIAEEVGVSRQALARAVEKRAQAAAAELAPAGAPATDALAVPAPAVPSTFLRDAGVAAGVVTVAAGVDLAVGLGGLIVIPALLLAGGALVGRSWLRMLAAMIRGQELPAATGADHAYRVTFGEGFIDLTHLDPQEPETVDVQVSFGEATVLLDPRVPYRLETSVVFGEVTRPNQKRRRRHGRDHRRERDEREESERFPTDLARPPRLIVRVAVRFGSARIRHASEDHR
ncbi:MAG: hypothetical protein P1V51_09490 [Deltaproteobacteria bacterium]|nr:hypothetical protein [Deltaproteobacteria bacterium]